MERCTKQCNVNKMADTSWPGQLAGWASQHTLTGAPAWSTGTGAGLIRHHSPFHLHNEFNMYRYLVVLSQHVWKAGTFTCKPIRVPVWNLSHDI